MLIFYDCPFLAVSSQALASWIFGSITLLFLIIAFFFVKGKLPLWKERVVAVIAALCAGLFAFFLTGYILLNIEYEFSNGAKIAIQAIGGLALFVIVLLWWFRTKSSPDPSDSQTPFDDKLIDKLVDVSESKGRLLDQIDYYKQQLAQAVKRIRELEAKGEYEQADQAIKDLRKSGNMTKLQSLLIEDRDRHRNELIQRNREIFAVAYLRGDIQTADNTVDQILTLLPDDMQALNQKGHIHFIQGRLNQAAEYYHRMLKLAQQQKDHMWYAEAINNLGIIYKTEGNLDQAERMYKKALEISTKLGSLEGQANQYGNLGNVYQTKGNLNEAVEMYRKVLDIEDKIRRPYSIANAYGNLGVIYGIINELDIAEDMFIKAIGIFEQMNLLEGQAKNYGNLGNIYSIKGDFGKAKNMYRKALDIFEQIGLLEGRANQYGNLGSLYSQQGNKEKAKEYYKKALTLFEQIGMSREIEQTQSALDSLDKN